jgi:coatomer subunit beta
VREAIEYFPELRQNIVEKLLDTFPHIKASNIYRAVMWILVCHSQPFIERRANYV